MKKLTNLIKSPETKKMIGLGVATAIGAAKGVKAVAEKRKADLANSGAKQKVAKVVLTTVAAGTKVVNGVREDLHIVLGSAKSQSCAARCPHCAVKDTYKPCCTDGQSCKAESSTEVEEQAPVEPVKAEEVVTAQEEADTVAETLKNDVLKAEKRAALADAKKTVRKPRTPRVAKDNAKPVSVNDVKEALILNPDGLLVGEIRDVETTPLKDVEKTEKED